jgi:hypothetical protein
MGTSLYGKNTIDAHPILIEFFEHPVGIAFLHRLMTSAHVSFTKAGTASIHNVSDFLNRSGLSPILNCRQVTCDYPERGCYSGWFGLYTPLIFTMRLII